MNYNAISQKFRVINAQNALRKAQGKTDPEIQAAVDAAVRAGSPAETTLVTLQYMRLSEEKISQFMRAAYPYPTTA